MYAFLTLVTHVIQTLIRQAKSISSEMIDNSSLYRIQIELLVPINNCMWLNEQESSYKDCISRGKLCTEKQIYWVSEPSKNSNPALKPNLKFNSRFDSNKKSTY